MWPKNITPKLSVKNSKSTIKTKNCITQTLNTIKVVDIN